MLEPIFVEGKQVYELPSLEGIRDYHREQLQLFWPQYLRKLNPEIYRVNLSEKIWEMKQKMIDSYMSTESDEH
ncbi:nicotinate phosphoribosyltransferase [compost metagenome]